MQAAVEPNLFQGPLAGALVVLFGALYALLFALGKMGNKRFLHGLALLAYLGFAFSVWLLADALVMEGFWLLIVAVMLVGYLLAPRLIWRLCVGTHAGQEDHSGNQETSVTKSNLGRTT